MEHRAERIVVETDNHRVTGDLTLPREGHRSRLSDFLNTGAPDFISLTDVELQTSSGAIERRAFAVVARAHVRLAHPLAVETGEQPD